MTAIKTAKAETSFSEDGAELTGVSGESKSFFAKAVDFVMDLVSRFVDFISGLFSGGKTSPRNNGDGTARLGKLAIDANAASVWEQYQDANKGARVEFTNPVRGGFAPITRDFGKRFHPIHKEMRHHDGVDLKPIRENQEIEASAAGIVLFAGVKEGYGNTVVIGHADGSWTLYAHLRDRPDANLVGTEVAQRQQIGVMGSSGGSTGVHLHYEQGKGNSRITPRIIEVGELKTGVDYAQRADGNRFAALADPKKHSKLPSANAKRGENIVPDTVVARNDKGGAQAQIS